MNSTRRIAEELTISSPRKKVNQAGSEKFSPRLDINDACSEQEFLPVISDQKKPEIQHDESSILVNPITTSNRRSSSKKEKVKCKATEDIDKIKLIGDNQEQKKNSDENKRSCVLQ